LAGAASKRRVWRLVSAKSCMPSNASRAAALAALFCVEVTLQPRW
jgi:hypothetical protein